MRAKAGLKDGVLAGVCRVDPKGPSENAADALGACDACIGWPIEKPDAAPVALPGTELLQTAPNMIRIRKIRMHPKRCHCLAC